MKNITLISSLLLCYACGVEKLNEPSNEGGPVATAENQKQTADAKPETTAPADQAAPTKEDKGDQDANETVAKNEDQGQTEAKGEEGPTAPEGAFLFEIRVTNIRNTTGNLCASVYDKAEGFPEDENSSVFVICADLDDFNGRLQVPDLDPDKTYAIAMFHDENENETLDKRAIIGDLAIPTEGFGFSNNPPLRIGPPAFDQTSFKPEAFKDGIAVELMYPIVPL